MSVVSLPRDGCPPFPFDAMDAGSREYVTLRSEQDVQRLFSSWCGPETDSDGKGNERRFEFARLAGVGVMLLDTASQDMIRRKRYCEKFNTSPFPGSYDDQPQWWRDAVVVMDNAEAEAINYLRRRNG